MRAKSSARRSVCTRHVAPPSSRSANRSKKVNGRVARYAGCEWESGFPDSPLTGGAAVDFTIHQLIQPRRQVVRHLPLTQTFGGSNPSGAATSRSYATARGHATRLPAETRPVRVFAFPGQACKESLEDGRYFPSALHRYR